MSKATSAAVSVVQAAALRNFSIAEFCEWCRISRAHFYNLQAGQLGPKTWRAGKRVLISEEAARAWREQQAEVAQ